MRLCSLGSGSTGNATVVEARSGTTTSRVLIDCGFSLRELEARLARAGLAPDDLDAVFVTHEHGDHVGCAVAFARREGLPLWMSRGTWRAIGEPGIEADVLHIARDGQAIEIGDLRLSPYTVAHDAQEPLQLRLTDGATHIGVLTDAGSMTPHLLAHLRGCALLLLECNHDRAMLEASRYPPSLKARIGGPWGHLSNETSADILAACMHDGLVHLVAAHLSEQNNRPELVRAALAASVDDLVIADPLLGCDWLAV
ncbi:MAG: MBL fold metallo-hydrolase [Proteobacteria bacterium]|nr:MBL fold metallo-hydrolase [Pseudomonadota bacterium]